MSVASSRLTLASSARYSSRQRSAVRAETDTPKKRDAARATLRTIGPRTLGSRQIDLATIGGRDLVELGPQRREIVIGEFGVDRPRECRARPPPESPVDRSADLQALLIGQDRFPPGT